MEKQKTAQEHHGAIMRSAMLASALLLLLFIAGCTSPTPQPPSSAPSPPPTPQIPPTSPAPPATSGCADQSCFITAANNCEDESLTLSDEVGTFGYSSTTSCIFTKTLLGLNESETWEMKNSLEGKSMTCKYEKGKFDSRLVTSIIFGMEYCEGSLKDALGKLLAFT